MPLYLSRFSNAVKKHFSVPSPRFYPEAFLHRILSIIQEHQIEYVIPSFEEIFYLSKGKHLFPKTCTLLCSSYSLLEKVHNKWTFNHLIKQLGFYAPRSVLLTNEKEWETLSLSPPYLVKPCYSRSALYAIRVMEPTQKRPIQIHPHNPWIAQEYIDGKKFCSFSIAHQGILACHVTYPVDIAIHDSSSLHFTSIEHPSILEWVQTFVEKTQFTGQLGMDFIETKKGELYAIECNPRGTSGLHLFRKEDRLGLSLLEKPTHTQVVPRGRKCQIGLGMLLYGWSAIGKSHSLFTFLKTLLTTKDVVFFWRDWKPWVSQLFLYPPYIWKAFSLQQSLPEMFTFDLNWDGDPSLQALFSPSLETPLTQKAENVL